jgi:hypothetical protein
MELEDARWLRAASDGLKVIVFAISCAEGVGAAKKDVREQGARGARRKSFRMADARLQAALRDWADSVMNGSAPGLDGVCFNAEGTESAEKRKAGDGFGRASMGNYSMCISAN